MPMYNKVSQFSGRMTNENAIVVTLPSWQCTTNFHNFPEESQTPLECRNSSLMQMNNSWLKHGLDWSGLQREGKTKLSCLEQRLVTCQWKKGAICFWVFVLFVLFVVFLVFVLFALVTQQCKDSVCIVCRIKTHCAVLLKWQRNELLIYLLRNQF